MKANRNIIIKPLLTEKVSDLTETERKVAFVVDPDANKIEIKRAVEKRFNVKVDKKVNLKMVHVGAMGATPAGMPFESINAVAVAPPPPRKAPAVAARVRR